MAKKARSLKKKAGRTTAKRRASRSGVRGVSILSDRKPPNPDCHVVVSSPGWGTCVDGGGNRCTFPGVKVGGKVTQMMLCETPNGKTRLFLLEPKKPRQRK